jgi:hypothetical protein
MTTYDDTSTTRALRDLDAADHDLDEAGRLRASATLERILATEPGAPGPTPAPIRSRHRRARHLLAAGALATAAAVVAVPLLTGGNEAFASWSPTPVELTGPARTAAAEACLVLQGGETGDLAFDPSAEASVLLAEARGGWTYVMFSVAGLSQRKLQGSCLMPDDLVAQPAPGEGGFFGSLGGAEEIARPGPRRNVVRQDESGVGSVADEAFVYAEGRAGRDVVGIEVTTPLGRKVQASLDHGRWAVWWPAGGDSMDNPEITQAPTYAVTLRDGTVVGGAHPGGSRVLTQ